ncbi:hypothetical protein AC579_887 [Pseudocercospora musae]|uniref:Tyrosine specific protein phosphatases domain-containing protein n=1 Tax=Pseudocercospora musae TaxID=113226 RepID=A0A139INE3_9PEZI|nr:hypothetical protein AC579_887 [Pseudocercospora musae]KXT16185.1 hypothetical protein AC579_887 [Pseudocercospora musae]
MTSLLSPSRWTARSELIIKRMSAAPLPPPFIDVPGIANFRDIGDNDDGKIRKRLVYRSADPSKATEEGLRKMSRDLGIKYIFDLRSQPEIKRDGPEWAGVEVDREDPFHAHGMIRSWVPVFAETDYGPEQVAVRYRHYSTGSEGFVQAYNDIALAAAPQAYRTIFRHLSKPNAEPCLIHCTAGKDRTGVIVALLSLLAGREKEVIAEEYSLTDSGLEHLKPLFQERLLKNPALQGNTEGVLNMISSKKENMLATVDMLQKDFNGPVEYMKQYCKMSDAEIEQLRKNLTSAA